MTVANTARTCYAAFETYIVSRRNPDLLVAMRRLQEGWPVQTRRQYAERLIKTLSLVLVGNPLVYGLLARGCEKAGRDLDDVVNGVSSSTARPRGTWRSSTAGKAGPSRLRHALPGRAREGASRGPGPLGAGPPCRRRGVGGDPRRRDAAADDPRCPRARRGKRSRRDRRHSGRGKVTVCYLRAEELRRD